MRHCLIKTSRYARRTFYVLRINLGEKSLFELSERSINIVESLFQVDEPQLKNVSRPSALPAEIKPRVEVIQDSSSAPARVQVKTPSGSPLKAPGAPTQNPVKTLSESPVKTVNDSPVKAPSSSPVKLSIAAPEKHPSISPIKTSRNSPVKDAVLGPHKTPSISPVKAATLSPAKTPNLRKSPIEPAAKTVLQEEEKAAQTEVKYLNFEKNCR